MIQKITLLFVFIFSLTNILNAQFDTLILRSEYEKVGDVIYDINNSNEGTISYIITSGNSSNYYTINSSTGIISIQNVIPDAFNIIRLDTLNISAGASTYRIRIADGFDYIKSKLSNSYNILSNDGDTYIDNTGKWTAVNNLWGRGTAIPNVDFRIATLYKAGLPDSTILIWDTPSDPSPYGGASVWCYHNVFWGNRKNVRENLLGFPFKISNIKDLNLDFEFQKLFGNEEYKIAMNMFMTDESYLTNFSANDGDLFFVFDQKGTFIPNYPYSLNDTIILGKPFALRYDNQDNGSFYERRRIIIKNNEKLLSGNLNIDTLFDRFVREGWLNSNQHIYHIQLGIEVTSGYGAVRINKANMNYSSNISLPGNSFVLKHKQISESNIVLNWEVENSNNIDYFMVYQSVDGSNWNVVSSISSSNSSNNSYSSQFQIKDEKEYFFRVCKIDKDGAKLFSNTITVKSSLGKNKLIVYPNPASQYLYVWSLFDKNISVEMFDALGQKVRSKYYIQQNGIKKIDISNLQNGIYTIRMGDMVSKVVVNN